MLFGSAIFIFPIFFKYYSAFFCFYVVFVINQDLARQKYAISTCKVFGFTLFTRFLTKRKCETYMLIFDMFPYHRLKQKYHHQCIWVELGYVDMVY